MIALRIAALRVKKASSVSLAKVFRIVVRVGSKTTEVLASAGARAGETLTWEKPIEITVARKAIVSVFVEAAKGEVLKNGKLTVPDCKAPIKESFPITKNVSIVCRFAPLPQHEQDASEHPVAATDAPSALELLQDTLQGVVDEIDDDTRETFDADVDAIGKDFAKNLRATVIPEIVKLKQQLDRQPPDVHRAVLECVNTAGLPFARSVAGGRWAVDGTQRNSLIQFNNSMVTAVGAELWGITSHQVAEFARSLARLALPSVIPSASDAAAVAKRARDEVSALGQEVIGVPVLKSLCGAIGNSVGAIVSVLPFGKLLVAGVKAFVRSYHASREIGELGETIAQDTELIVLLLQDGDVAKMIKAQPASLAAMERFTNCIHSCSVLTQRYAKSCKVKKAISGKSVLALLKEQADALPGLYSTMHDTISIDAHAKELSQLSKIVKDVETLRQLYEAQRMQGLVDRGDLHDAARVLEARAKRLTASVERRQGLMTPSVLEHVEALRCELNSVRTDLEYYKANASKDTVADFAQALLRHNATLDSLCVDLQTAQGHDAATQSSDTAQRVRELSEGMKRVETAVSNFATVTLNESQREKMARGPSVAATTTSAAALKAYLFNAALIDVAHVSRVNDEKLGVGSFGDIHPGTCYGEPVAMKCFHKLMKRDERAVRNEVILMQPLRHPNICGCKGVVLAEDYDAIVLELIEGQTFHSKLPTMPWRERLSVVVQVAAAMAFLHSHKIIHNDLRAENIMVSDSNTAKLIDFGVATTKSTILRYASEPVKLVGTLLWTAPELIRGEVTTGDEMTDVYSMGMVLVEALTADIPYGSSIANGEAVSCARSGVLPGMKPDFSIEPSDSKTVRDVQTLAAQCLGSKDKRPTTAQISALLRELLP